MNGSLRKRITQKLKGVLKKEIEERRAAYERTIPKYELSKKHISNLRAIENRNALLHVLPQKAIIAEIGVNKGDFSEQILQISKPKKLHLIDIWNSERYHRGLMKHVEERFKNEINNRIIEINLGLSTDMDETFEDNYFDWVYIDTAHTYSITKAELELYSKKVKNDGVIAGHDFTPGNWIKGYRYGVIEAVYEFCVKNDWEIIFLTMETNIHPSFAIRKIRTDVPAKG